METINDYSNRMAGTAFSLYSTYIRQKCDKTNEDYLTAIKTFKEAIDRKLNTEIKIWEENGND